MTDQPSGDPQVLEPAQVPFAALAEGFERAWESRHGCTELRLKIAGFSVRVRIAGDALAQVITAPLAHLLVEGAPVGSPELTIDVWDRSATTISWVPVGSPVGGDAADGGPLILLQSSKDGRFVGERRAHATQWLDRQQSRIVGCIDRYDRLNLDQRARPFHKMLSMWLEDRGVQFVHAGLVAHRDRGLLFVGSGGAGKSTSSIACLQGGMDYLGDDFVGFSRDGDTFTGHGIYGSCLLNVHHIKRFPVLEDMSHEAHFEDEDKRIVYLDKAFAGALRDRVDIAALILPRVVDAPVTRTVPARKPAALMAIAPTSVMFLPRPNRAALARLAELVAALPCYWLELGRDIGTIYPTVAALADGLGSNLE